MLLPISPINPKTSLYQYKKAQNKENNCAVSGGFKSIYGKNPPNFTYYMGFKGRKDIVFSPDYYELPSITLPDGSIHQFMPDKSQIECAQKLLEGDSVLYCAPTGTGKTAVIHFAVNKNLDEGKRTLITVPLVALANDKYREFSKIYGVDKVGIMTGDRKLNPNAPVVIMTTEILYNQSADLSQNPSETGTIVFDEAHYMSDVQRGSVWEKSIMASVPNDIPVLCLSATVGNADKFNGWVKSLNDVQSSSLVELKPEERYVPLVWQVYNPKTKEKFLPVVQYSVDVENLSLDTLSDKQKRAISRIIQIQNYKNEFYKPSENEIKKAIETLKESVRKWYQSVEDFEEDFSAWYPEFSEDETREIAHLLRNEKNKYVKHIYSKYQPNDNYKPLIDDLKAQNKLPAIIFKLSRGKCDEVLFDFLFSEIDLTTDDEKEEIKKIIEKYKSHGYLGKDIGENALISGYGVHHAGKLPEYRKLVEELFSKKLLKVVVSTSTLSAGINMPARSVILSDMTYRKYDPQKKEMENTILTVSEFHQMAGRAGRRGIDNIGNVILYNLKSIPDKFKNEEHNQDRIDEQLLAYEYIGESPDDIRSQFRPDPVIVAKYFGKEGREALAQTINKSFAIYSLKSDIKDERAKRKLQQFENYAHVLLKQGFMYRDYKNNYELTPKGELLLNAQGINPLMMINLIYDEFLADLTPVNLAQIAGYIAGSDEMEEPQELSVALDEILEQKTDDKRLIKEFRKLRQQYQQKEEKLLRSLNESKVPLYDVLSSDSVSGLVAFLWADYNSKNDNSIENFERITSIEAKSEDKDTNSSLEAKLSEGKIYRTISHSISVLKQIQRICDIALSDPENYPNCEYYENLKENATWALDLMDRKPISVEDVE